MTSIDSYESFESYGLKSSQNRARRKVSNIERLFGFMDSEESIKESEEIITHIYECGVSSRNFKYGSIVFGTIFLSLIFFGIILSSKLIILFAVISFIALLSVVRKLKDKNKAKKEFSIDKINKDLDIIFNKTLNSQVDLNFRYGYAIVVGKQLARKKSFKNIFHNTKISDPRLNYILQKQIYANLLYQINTLYQLTELEKIAALYCMVRKFHKSQQ